MPPVTNARTVEVQMLIRRPPVVVFDALINPDITSNFWFSRGSGRLETGTTVTWYWDMYGVSTEVHVLEVIPNQRISVEWGAPPTTVVFELTAMSEETTLVIIKNYGFREEGDALLNTIKDSTGGFTTVLDGMKAYLEHDIQLNLVADKFPGKASK